MQHAPDRDDLRIPGTREPEVPAAAVDLPAGPESARAEWAARQPPEPEHEAEYEPEL